MLLDHFILAIFLHLSLIKRNKISIRKRILGVLIAICPLNQYNDTLGAELGYSSEYDFYKGKLLTQDEQLISWSSYNSSYQQIQNMIYNPKFEEIKIKNDLPTKTRLLLPYGLCQVHKNVSWPKFEIYYKLDLFT